MIFMTFRSDALTLLGNSVYTFSMKRSELLKSEFEVAPAYKFLCHESHPITTMLFGDELPQSIRNVSQVKRMVANSIRNDHRKSNASPYARFKKPLVESSRGRQYATLASYAVVFEGLVVPPPHKSLLNQAPHSFPIVLLPKHPSESPSKHCLMISSQITGYKGRFRFPRAFYSLQRCGNQVGIYIFFHFWNG